MSESFYDLYCEQVIKCDMLIKENKQLRSMNLSLTNRINYLETNQDRIIETKVNKQIGKITHAFEEKVISLSHEVSRLKAVLNNDGSNSGIPTSLTPIHKNKRIPNSRMKSDKKKGGQTNHPKHKLEKFKDDEITDSVYHRIETCTECGNLMNETTSITCKDECDFDIVVKKRRHYFIETVCSKCGHTERMNIPTCLKEDNQYGQGVQALALTLMNEGFVSMNRTKDIITGLTHNEINISEGYISKLQKRLSDHLINFINELDREVIKLDLIHWDDTVIAVSGNRACLRFYGDDKMALYKSHMHKDKEGLDEDKILLSLDEKTVVMHDHNIVNYNEDYNFINVECCVHLLRDLKKVVDNLNHEWPKHMINMLLSENDKRNKGDYIDSVYIGIVYDQYISEGEYENIEAESKYYGDTEKTLLKRLKIFKDNYLMWTLNEEIPFSNNISERALRSSKTKMKVSGQFNNIKSAENYASIKSYLETGHRHGINSTELIKRALEGKAVSIEEMKEHDKDEL